MGFFLPLLGTAAAALLVKKAFYDKKARFPGDLAQPNDIAFVPVINLGSTNVPPLPPGTLYVGLKVVGGNADLIQGVIVAFGDQMLPTIGIGAFTVQRKDVIKVMRDGKVIAFQPGAKVGAEG